MLSNLTIIFPLAVALFILVWTCRWARIHAEAVPRLKGPRKAGGDHDGADRRFTKLDWIVMLALTAAYAVVGFVGLGSTKAPQTYLHYESGNMYAQIELAQPQRITALRYWSGLNTADYILEFSPDGENWTDQVLEDGTSGMTQQYTQLFRWNDATLNAGGGETRYIRIISGAEQELGEIAVYGADGQLIPADQLIPAPGCEALLDEQDVVPEKYTYKNGTYFDEIYHARTAKEMIDGIWPYEITHPPLGKAIMSLGIRMFGMTPFGWRFMGVLVGVLMLPLLYMLLKRMFGYTAAAGCGSAVMAVDFMHFTQTRIATIDSYVVFFIVAMYLFMYMWASEPPENRRKRLIWLGLAGLSFGMGAASKWTGIYAGAGLGVIWLVYWVMRLVRAPKKQQKDVRDEFILNIAHCIVFFVLVPFLVYYASYWSYGPSQGFDGPFRLFKPGYFKMVIDNQTYMWNYHSGLVATHPYSSKWYQWLFDVRPILYYLEYPGDGTTISFGAFNNPVTAWGGLCAMVGLGWIAVRERDEKAIFILIGYLANLLPWVLVTRLTWSYHYFPCTVFLVLAIGYLFADLRRRDEKWKAALGSFTGLAAALFAVFYPVLAGTPRSAGYSKIFLKWFTDTWPF